MRRVALIAALTLPCAACGQVAGAQMHMVANLQIQEAVRGYEQARKGGDPLDMCVKAKLVAVAYADARQTADASAWRARETEDCRLAMGAMNVQTPGAGGGR